MARRIKPGTEAQWHALAEQAKFCERELIKLADMAYELMPVRIGDRLLNRIVNGHLLRFRLEAEREMLQRGGPRDFSIFYR